MTVQKTTSCAYAGYSPGDRCCLGGPLRFRCRVARLMPQRRKSMRDVWTVSELMEARREARTASKKLVWD